MGHKDWTLHVEPPLVSLNARLSGVNGCECTGHYGMKCVKVIDREFTKQA